MHRGRASRRAGPAEAQNTHIGSPDPISQANEPGGEPVRRLRISAPVQLSLDPQANKNGELWEALPTLVQRQVLALLSRLIARGVVEEDEGDG